MMLKALCHDHTWRSRGTAPGFFTSALNVLHARTALPRGKGCQSSLDRKLAGPQNRSQRYGEKKNFALPGIEPGSSRPQLVAILTDVL
jgi:hypothetical protein